MVKKKNLDYANKKEAAFNQRQPLYNFNV